MSESQETVGAGTELPGKPRLVRVGQSRAGIACFILGLAACLGFLVGTATFAAISPLEQWTAVHGREHPFFLSVSVGLYYPVNFILSIVSPVLGFLAGIAGLVAGGIGLMQGKRKRKYAVIGLIVIALAWPLLMRLWGWVVTAPHS
jgi:hypothetical protein